MKNIQMEISSHNQSVFVQSSFCLNLFRENELKSSTRWRLTNLFIAPVQQSIFRWKSSTSKLHCPVALSVWIGFIIITRIAMDSWRHLWLSIHTMQGRHYQWDEKNLSNGFRFRATETRWKKRFEEIAPDALIRNNEILTAWNCCSRKIFSRKMLNLWSKTITSDERLQIGLIR